MRLLYPKFAILSLFTILSIVYACAPDRASSSLTISEINQHYELTVPALHTALVVPKGNLRVVKNPDYGGATSNPRFFILIDRTDGEMIISGWIESSKKVTNIDKMLQDSWNSVQEGLESDPFQVQSSVAEYIGDWSTIIYSMSHKSISDMHSSHIRASRVVGDTWIDLHLSVTRRAPVEECSQAVIELLRSISVRSR